MNDVLKTGRAVAMNRRHSILTPVARCLMPAASRPHKPTPFVKGSLCKKPLLKKGGRGGFNDGFTLLELIVVIVLISLTLGLSGVYFAGTLPGARLDAAARELSASIGYARAQARITGATQRVILDLDGRSFGLEGRNPRRLPDGSGMKVIDPDRGEVLQGRHVLAARAGGLVEGGTIVLTNGRRIVTVEPDPIVGSVVIR